MSDRTEAPTPQRLREARKEGRVARSIELNSAAILLVAAFSLTTFGRGFVASMSAIIRNSIAVMPDLDFSSTWLRDWLLQQAVQIVPALLGFMAIFLLAGVSVTLVQTGFLWTSKKIGFDFKRVDPVQGLKRMFSVHALVEMLKALLKLVLIGYVAYSYLSKRYGDMLTLSQMDFLSAVGHWADLALSLAARIGGAYLVLAAADYGYQRWEFMRSMRMSKQEIKEEIRRSEGDPFMRSRIRAQQRRMARTRMMANVPKANVIVTNPTHFAVAIQYDPETMAAPKVLAKGAYVVAQKIVEVATDNHIPVVQNIPLARGLYKAVNIEQEIPQEFYVAVAEVLAYVYSLQKNKRALLPA